MPAVLVSQSVSHPINHQHQKLSSDTSLVGHHLQGDRHELGLVILALGVLVEAEYILGINPLVPLINHPLGNTRQLVLTTAPQVYMPTSGESRWAGAVVKGGGARGPT